MKDGAHQVFEQKQVLGLAFVVFGLEWSDNQDLSLIWLKSGTSHGLAQAAMNDVLPRCM